MNKYIYAINRRLTSTYNALFDNSFAKDSNYKTKNIEIFFKSNPSKFFNHAILNQILDYYEIALKTQKVSGYKYQIGNEWLPIYENQMVNLKKILNKKNIEELSRVYNNFFRERFSSGLHGDSGYDRFKKRFLKRKISVIDRNLYVKQCLYAFSLWKKLISNFNLDELLSKRIGNEYLFEFDGKIINPNYFKNHYYAYQSYKLIEGTSGIKYVFELGGGYGNYAYFLNLNQNVKYLGCDLPENLSLSYFYLSSLMPNKKIKLISDLKKDELDFKNYDIILISNYDIENLPENFFDLSFNSYSLAEMHKEAIENYIDHISRISSKFIYHVNHTKYSVNSSDNFPISKNKFILHSKNESLWNKYTNKFSDEYEFTYKAI